MIPKTPGSIELPEGNSGTDLGNLANLSALRRRSTSRPSIKGLADRTNLEIRRHCTHQKLIIVMKPVSQTAVSMSRRIRIGTWEAVGCATGMAIGVLRAVTSKNGWLISSIAT
jgi:hypothetical protein